MFDIQDWDLFWGSMFGIGVCDTGLGLRFWMLVWIQVWGQVMDSCFVFRFGIQVLYSGLGFKFKIQDRDQSLRFMLEIQVWQSF